MDGVENKNGRLVKKLARECGMEVLNCVIDGLVVPTWSGRMSEYSNGIYVMNKHIVQYVK